MSRVSVLVVSLVSFASSVGALSAQEALSEPILLACKSGKGEPFSIELFRETRWGPMHCVEGLSIADMTPCAPDGGWGLSLATGMVPIVDVTSSWAVASRHNGGKFYARLGQEKFEAAATYGESLEPEFSVGSYDYAISLDRSSGQGFYLTGGNEMIAVECQTKDRKF